MPHQGAPRTFQEAQDRGYKKIDDIEAFARDRFGLSGEQFHARQHAMSVLPPVDCSTAPPGTPCSFSCDSATHVGVFGRCENGGCAYHSGPC